MSSRRRKLETSGSVGRFFARHVLLPMVLVAAVVVLIEERRAATRTGRPAVQKQIEEESGAIPVAPVPPEPPVRDEAVAPPEEPAPKPGHDHLSASLLRPRSRHILWQIGKLNGRPARVDGPLSAEEFGTHEFEGEALIVEKGKEGSDFPQVLMPEQKVVVHLPEFQAEDLVLGAWFGASTPEQDWFDLTLSQPWVEIRFNGVPIWQRLLPRHPFPLSALLPTCLLEEYENTVTFMNRGKLPVCFDAVWIEAAAGTCRNISCDVGDWYRLPAYAKRLLPRASSSNWRQAPRYRIARKQMLLGAVTHTFPSYREKVPVSREIRHDWRYYAFGLGLEQQEETIERFLESCLGFFFHGGSELVLSDLVDVRGMFCPRTGQPYPCGYAFRELGQLFDGAARRQIPVNVLPAGEDGAFLDRVYWIATQHSDDKVTVLAARSCFGRPPDEVRVTLTVPWQGHADVVSVGGVFPRSLGMAIPGHRGYLGGPAPEGYDRERVKTKRRFKLTDCGPERGMLDEVFEFRDCVSLEILNPEQDNQIAKKRMPDFRSRILTVAEDEAPTVTKEREEPGETLLTLGPAPVLFAPISSNYKVSKCEATKAIIGRAKHVAPLYGESIALQVSYPAGRLSGAEGIALDMEFLPRGELPEKVLSFWVMPRPETEGLRTVNLGLMAGSRKAVVPLEPNTWQRVLWNLGFLEGETSPHLVFYADHREPEYAGEAKVIFELNGVSVRPRVPGPLPSREKWLKKDDTLGIVVLGQPGEPMTARMFFDEAVTVRRVDVLLGNGRPTWTYDLDCQMLKVSGIRFPTEVKRGVEKLLTAEERNLCRADGLLPAILSVQVAQ